VIDVLLPEIHGRPTGGNLYNARIFFELAKITEVREHIGPIGPIGPTGPIGPILVDSLLLDTPVEGAILLAHYLHLMEHRDSEKAARERAHLARYRAAIATSEYARDALGAIRCVAIPPGLDDAYREAVAPRHNDVPRIATVANFFPDKGLVDAIEVLESLRDLEWEWHLAGDPTLDPQCAQAFHDRLARSAIADRVHVLGPLHDVQPLYDRADVFLLLARFESCSMVTREAMARALPVVAYPAGGLASNLPRETQHLLSPLDDREGIAATLRRLLGDREEREMLGGINREAAMRFPTWEESARELHAFLLTLSHEP